MHLLGYLAAAGAAGAAGAINAVAGGGTLVSFSTLLGLGVPAVTANVTNTVALVPAYLAGSWGQRSDLKPQLRKARGLAVAAFTGGLGGSILLINIPAGVFRLTAPYLILFACALLLVEGRLRSRIGAASVDAPAPDTEDPERRGAVARSEHPHQGMRAGPRAPSTSAWTPPAVCAVFAAAVYGGFFGAGLGIMVMAVLSLFGSDSLVEVNALKQALSFIINLVAAGFFLFSGHVSWPVVPAMAVAGVAGGLVGSRLVRVIKPSQLRVAVIVTGVAVAIALWVT